MERYILYSVAINNLSYRGNSSRPKLFGASIWKAVQKSGAEGSRQGQVAHGAERETMTTEVTPNGVQGLLQQWPWLPDS